MPTADGASVVNFRYDPASKHTAPRLVCDEAPPWNGVPVARYRLFRKHGFGNYVSVNTNSAPILYDRFVLPFSPDPYHYFAVVEYDSEGVTYTSPSSAVVRYVPFIASIPLQITVNVFLFTPRNVAPPYDTGFVSTLIFSDTAGDSSLHNYLREVSAGCHATPAADAIRAIRISGTVRDWETLDHDQSHYAGTGAYLSEIRDSGRLADLQAQFPADHYVLIVNSGAGGGEGGGNVITVGAEALKWKGSFSVIAHELGHDFGLQHASAFYCETGSLPADLHTFAGCDMATYSDLTDTMSGTSSLTHYNGYHKAVLGFLNGRVRIEDIIPGEVRIFDLFDSSTITAQRDTQLLLIRLDQYDSALVVEYRRPIGFNQFAVRGDEVVPLPRAVYVYFRPGRLMEGQANTSDTWTPYTFFSYRDPIVATTEQDFIDAARGITIRVINDQDWKVTVRVSRYAQQIIRPVHFDPPSFDDG